MDFMPYTAFEHDDMFIHPQIVEGAYASAVSMINVSNWYYESGQERYEVTPCYGTIR